MEKMMIENNVAILTGEIVEDLVFSHEVFGEGFYTMKIAVSRLSSAIDTIPVMVSDRYPVFDQLKAGSFVSVTGQYRSYNRHDAEPKLILSVFARDVFFIDEPGTMNEITLAGNICKKPVLRETPLHKHVCDLLVAVNRQYEKSDYIPCIVWGRNAAFSNTLEVGDFVTMSGRIQSREYMKKEKRMTTYEVSISRISKGE